MRIFIDEAGNSVASELGARVAASLHQGDHILVEGHDREAHGVADSRRLDSQVESRREGAGGNCFRLSRSGRIEIRPPRKTSRSSDVRLGLRTVAKPQFLFSTGNQSARRRQ